MPRVLSPQEPSGPGSVINLPRPRHVGAAPTGLPEFGAAVSDAGNQWLRLAVDQERRAESLRIRTRAEERYADLRQRVDEAGTAADGRAIWQTEGAKVKQELARFAEERGLPEMAPELDLHAAQVNGEVLHTLGKRSLSEAAEAGQVYAITKGEAMVAARSEAEATRHKTELHRALEELAQLNPMFSAADADKLYLATVSDAATRRTQTAMARAANNPEALRGLAASIREGSFADLPADSQAVLAQRADDAADQAQLHNLAMQDRAEAREERLARRAREGNEAGLRVKVARGEATETELVDALARRDISTDAFNGLLRSMETDAEESDHPATAIELRHRMYLGDADSGDVMEARDNGLLSQETTEELLRLDNELARREDSPLSRDSVKRARNFLVDSITGPRGPLGQLLDPNDAAREASAVREYDQRVLGGEDQWEVAEQLIPQFRVTSQQPLTAIGKPIGLVGTLREPDVPATAQALIDMLERGEITEETFEREVDRLERLGAAATDAQLKRQEAEAAARSRQ